MSNQVAYFHVCGMCLRYNARICVVRDGHPIGSISWDLGRTVLVTSGIAIWIYHDISMYLWIFAWKMNTFRRKLCFEYVFVSTDKLSSQLRNGGRKRHCSHPGPRTFVNVCLFILNLQSWACFIFWFVESYPCIRNRQKLYRCCNLLHNLFLVKEPTV